MGFWFDMFDMFVGILMGPIKNYGEINVKSLHFVKLHPQWSTDRGLTSAEASNSQLLAKFGRPSRHPQFQRIPWTIIPMNNGLFEGRHSIFKHTYLRRKTPTSSFRMAKYSLGSERHGTFVRFLYIMDKRKVPWGLSFWEGTPIEIPIQAWYSMFS